MSRSVITACWFLNCLCDQTPISAPVSHTDKAGIWSLRLVSKRRTLEQKTKSPTTQAISLVGDPYFSFQKQLLFTIISTLSKNEQKINVGS